jgi:hypothetical protein
MALLDALLSLKSRASCKGLAMLAIIDVSMHSLASGQVIMLIWAVHIPIGLSISIGPLFR